MDTARITHPAPLDTRELRALDLYRRRGKDIRRIAPDVYRVPSQDGERSYDVLYGEGNLEECPCPDHQHRGVNCVHILCVGIYHAKHRRSEASPYAPPCSCNNGWVSMEVENEDGTLEEVLYLCRRCSEAAGDAREPDEDLTAIVEHHKERARRGY